MRPLQFGYRADCVQAPPGTESPDSLSVAVQNMPLGFARGTFGANHGAEFSGVPTNCKASQWLYGPFPSASILYMSTPAIPVSFGSSLKQIQEIHVSKHIVRPRR